MCDCLSSSYWSVCFLGEYMEVITVFLWESRSIDLKLLMGNYDSSVLKCEEQCWQEVGRLGKDRPLSTKWKDGH